MVYIESDRLDPYFNLALEEYIFEKLDPHKSYFMLWQNDNTIVIGKNQNTAEEINQEFAEAHGIRVVRRLSGGGAVYHDKGNLNFTFITDRNRSEDFNFSVFTMPVIRALEKAGVHAELTGRNDITIDGTKISGNAQYAKRDRVMHHGCIMLDSNLDMVSGALKVKAAKISSKGIKSVRSRVTTINAHAPKPLSIAEFKSLLREEILRAEPDSERWAPEGEALAEIERLAEERYASWEWNYGYSPAYNLKQEEKFPAGLVTVYADVRESRIENVRIYGDFFGNGEIAELEEAMKGLLLDDSLKEKLEALHPEKYMNGIGAEELYRLLRY